MPRRSVRERLPEKVLCKHLLCAGCLLLGVENAKIEKMQSVPSKGSVPNGEILIS